MLATSGGGNRFDQLEDHAFKTYTFPLRSTGPDVGKAIVEVMAFQVGRSSHQLMHYRTILS